MSPNKVKKGGAGDAGKSSFLQRSTRKSCALHCCHDASTRFFVVEAACLTSHADVIPVDLNRYHVWDKTELDNVFLSYRLSFLPSFLPPFLSSVFMLHKNGIKEYLCCQGHALLFILVALFNGK
jgi:hypothetical protein